MIAGELAKVLRGELRGDPQARVEGFSIDSRQVGEGDVFFALKGERHDGHDFVTDAVDRGAVGCVVERDVEHAGKFSIKVSSTQEALRELALYRRGIFRGEVVGVAGSVGKTTTKELIHHLLSNAAASFRSEGNLNSQIGLPLVVCNMPLEVDYAVLELGASAVGDVERLVEVAQPKVRVITALGEEHLESFGTLEDVVKGNGEIFRGFTEDSRAVIPHYALEYYDLPRERVTTFGEGGDLNAGKVRLSLKGTEFEFWGEGFSVPLLSRGVVQNVLAAFGVLTSLGYDPRDFREALKSFTPPQGRMNLLNFGNFFVVDDTYNANPPSVRNALTTLASLQTTSKKVAVLGDMLELGVESGRYHAEVGKLGAELGIDVIIFHGEESKRSYEECIKHGGNALFCDKKEDIVDELLKYMRDKNIILVKGSRGMRMEWIVEKMGELVGYGA
ncbi:UDP-N-acetylmuramoyl-tripeptide--D-alanyl-D-alanine ligase [Hydrogenivirga sp. 128-5-R1-1]|uniref:UDP-N-acetylmuramoyl-tripeptide--D-alanyl-D- alanine ligase n=1 Tax=Hydrogenivirga sp. 128-5-R1-1 TaxID=392423 RepID=UPI00015EF965|nr:UDP-N-acetylmuramoyl-tripeptide--D-alanyl-D-alanine ligase [Hydrogenivirga sp. 128-5-R1-1]EDP74533.1 UDP-MURNAC-pentapeptide sythetase [Hydrogenivirga sp. 128-5-R1-1]